MATLETMYPAQPNTPENSTTDAISEYDTKIPVISGASLPDAPNILTLGADTASAETVLMTAKHGDVITVQRGYDGTTALPWGAGTLVGRFLCAADQNTMQKNIVAMNEEIDSKAGKSKTISVTIPSNAWINGENTVAAEGLLADSNGIIGCPSLISDAQLKAVKLAELTVSGQADGQITVKASGTVPDIDIPAIITIIG